MATKKPNTTMQIFNFTDDIRVRAIIGDDGLPWFVAVDVCAVLDVTNTTNALKRLDEDEQALYSIKGLTKGNDNLNFVNESGLYSLILTSRKPEAKKFKKWVTAEVLPSIRKSGSYQVAQLAKTPAPMIEDQTEQWFLTKMRGGAIVKMVQADEPCSVNFIRQRFPDLEVINKRTMRNNLQFIMSQLSELCSQFTTMDDINADFAAFAAKGGAA